MTKAKTSPNSTSPASILKPHAYHKTANEVIRLLKKTIDIAECPAAHELTQKKFGRLIGAPKSTIHDWYHGRLAAQIEHFLCAMERLSEPQRTGLLHELCRTCPRINHSRLAHDPQAINSLKALIAQPVGLTLVAGTDDATRTFLITAIGNSATQLIPMRNVSGFDVHTPDSFVPVSGVLYFRNPKDLMNVRQLIQRFWGEIEKSTADLVLLNAVWTIVPELRERIIGLSARRHVIVADQFDGATSKPKEAYGRRLSIVKTISELDRRIRLIVSAGDLT